MKKPLREIRKFINSQRLYTWLIIFILLINITAIFHAKLTEEPQVEKEAALFPYTGDFAEKRAALEAKLNEDKNLAIIMALATGIIVISILAGIIVNIALLILKINKIKFIPKTLRPPEVKWTMSDVVKVIILFIFFAYMLILIEASLAGIFPSIKNQEAIRSAVNTTILDLLAIFFVLYFVVGRYGQKIRDLGISTKNFFTNLFTGLAGYIAIIPGLVLVSLFVFWLVSIFKYEPPPQPVVEMFVKENRIPALLYISIFVGILGPIAEEIFFRGFMYNAVKKGIGIFPALLTTSFFFAVLHAHLVGFLPIMVLGMLLAYLYEKTGSLIPSITVHIIHNSVMISFVFLMKEIYV